MLNSAAFKLYSDGSGERILDTDFYAFLGCTVRTPANDFFGRLNVTDEAVKTARRTHYPRTEAAVALQSAWSYIGQRFNELIERRKAKH